jgi:glycosyltransferase involved in cell wall biosynthesis
MTRALRIVLVCESFAPAADPAAETARQVCDALLADGHAILVLTMTAGKRSYRDAEVVRLRRAPAAATLRAHVSGFAPDVVQVLHPRGLGTTAMRALEHEEGRLVTLDPTLLSPRVGTLLASSHATARLLAMVGATTRVWTPGVRTDEHHPGLRSEELHDAWTKGGPDLVVGYAGPVGASTTKHVRRLARIAALDGVRLVVLGCGPGTATLKQAGARIVGECGGLELARGLASLDVLVQPRKSEAHLGVVRKALASGVPVVAFETASTTEVVTHGRHGLLVAPGQGRTGLADAVTRLAGDPSLRAALASRARDAVAGRTWADAVAELVEIYAEDSGALTAVGA